MSISTPATLDDVARLAGVSAKTVSRVVNGEAGVHPETSARVRRAIASLGYRRNDVARNLRKGLSVSAVGLLIEDLGNPFYAILARAVESIARRHGYALVITSSGEEPTHERELLTDLLRRGMDGLLIVAAGHDHRYLDAALRPGVPAVFLDRPPGGIEADMVGVDNVVGGRMGTRHLLAHGHRRIAFVGDAATVTTSVERLAGYVEALTEAGIPRDETLIRLNPPGIDATQASTRQLLALDRPPTAFLAQNNRNCVGVMRAMRAMGEVRALVGIDDFELADMLYTPVTVVSHDPADMGRTGAELLFARMAGDSRPTQRITIPVRLIERGSGELPPVS